MTDAQTFLEQRERRIQLLVTAALDMDETIAACKAREHQEPSSSDLDRALETAIVVSYARPFTSSNRVGSLGRKWRPAAGTPEREVHDWLLAERKRRYAHTDVDSGRLVLHKGTIETGFEGLVEMTPVFPVERLEQVRALAEALHERLMEEAFNVQRQIVAEFG